MIIKQSTTQTTYYVETDHQGSIIGLLNTNGTYAEKYSYDAWGRRRNTTDWSFNNVPLPTLIERGYTRHEHLDKFGIINMNGRMYDPYLGRFLSVDPVIQSTTNSQTFNGYSYCLNNPLKFTDPTGYSYGNDAWTNPYSEHSVTEMMSGLFGQMAGDLAMSLVDQNSFWNYFETLISGGSASIQEETQSSPEKSKSKGKIDAEVISTNKLTFGVQAGGNVGGLGGKYGIFCNLGSITLLGNENGKLLYPGSQQYGTSNLSQLNQSLAGGLFIGGTLSHTQDVSFENSFSLNDKLTYQGFLGNKGTWMGISYNYNPYNQKKSISFGFSFQFALILGIESNWNVIVSW